MGWGVRSRLSQLPEQEGQMLPGPRNLTSPFTKAGLHWWPREVKRPPNPDPGPRVIPLSPTLINLPVPVQSVVSTNVGWSHVRDV